MYTTQYTVCTIQCTVHRIQCTVHTCQCSVTASVDLGQRVSWQKAAVCPEYVTALYCSLPRICHCPLLLTAQNISLPLLLTAQNMSLPSIAQCPEYVTALYCSLPTLLSTLYMFCINFKFLETLYSSLLCPVCTAPTLQWTLYFFVCHTLGHIEQQDCWCK